MQKCEQEMLGFDCLLAAVAGQIGSFLQSLLGLFRELVRSHDVTVPPNMGLSNGRL